MWVEKRTALPSSWMTPESRSRSPRRNTGSRPARRRRLGDEPDPRLDVLLRGEVIHAEHPDLARVAPDEVQDDLDDGRLPGAVGSDQAHDRAGGDGERDVLQPESLVFLA